jgi:hypothetical protein
LTMLGGQSPAGLVREVPTLSEGAPAGNAPGESARQGVQVDNDNDDDEGEGCPGWSGALILVPCTLYLAGRGKVHSQ